MFCGKCGTKNEDNARFCEKCGNPLTAQEIQYQMPQQMERQGNFPSAKNSFFQKIHLILLVFILLGGYGGYSFIKTHNTPEKTAELYFTALKNGSLKEAEKYIDWSDTNVFTNKKAFENMALAQIEEISYCKVNKAKIASPDDSQQYDVDSGNVMSVTYRLKERKENQYELIEMEQLDKKKWFFLPQWKVSLSSWLGHNYTIFCQENQTVTVNGKNIEKYAQTEDGQKKYILPEFFNTDYELKAVTDGCEFVYDYESWVYLYSDGDFEIPVQEIKEEKICEVIKKAGADIQNFISYAYAGKSFSDLKEIMNMEIDDELETIYEQQKSYYQLEENGGGIIKMNLYDFVVNGYQAGSDQEGNLQITIAFDFAADYVSRYISIWSGEKTDYDYTDDSNRGYFRYFYDSVEKTWVLKAMSVDIVGY